jgi:putative NIF3 family GTP cyclohydrolase 1 type 2
MQYALMVCHDAAIDEKTDALFVHHGFFWKNEAAEIIGIKKIG